MRVREIHNEAGVLTGFAVSNTLLGRWRACRIARRVPGAIVGRWPRRFARSDDDFCAFTVDGLPFLIIEPFGDNDCYWIVAERPWSSQLLVDDAAAADWRPLIRQRDVCLSMGKWQVRSRAPRSLTRTLNLTSDSTKLAALALLDSLAGLFGRYAERHR